MDLNGPEFKSKEAVKRWDDDAIPPGSTILMHLVTARHLTPSQVTRLVDDIGLDITATDDDNVGILHLMADESLTPIMLRTVASLMKKHQGEAFEIDALDKEGTTPFQEWLQSVRRNVGKYMDVVNVWDELGVDITQTDGKSANNMLHLYLTGPPSLIKLVYLRKMCFDDINPWRSEEQDDGSCIVHKKRKLGAFQAPMHARQVPHDSLDDNRGRIRSINTLFKMYMKNAVGWGAPVNVNILEYFRSKKKDGVRMITDDTTSPLWQYMKHTNVKLAVLKYLKDDLECVLKPKPDDRILFTYMAHQSKRKQLNLDVLDYFYGLGKEECDFMFHEKSISVLHSYVTKSQPKSADDFPYVSYEEYKALRKRLREKRHMPHQIFNCRDFETFVKRYELESLIKRENEDEKEEDETESASGSNKLRSLLQPVELISRDIAYQSAAATFYKSRTSEITAEIVTCFTKLGFNINEAIDKQTPLQIYCGGSKYVLKRIVRAFISSGADVNRQIDDKQAVSMCEILFGGKIASLKMMLETFGVKLLNTKKRTKDPWYKFMEKYKSSKQFDRFIKLATNYANHKCDPLHLLHSERDGDHRIQFKVYRVSDQTKLDVDDEKEFSIKKSQKRLKIARKYLDRFVVVVDKRAALFRDCKLIVQLTSKDTRKKIKIPEKWLQPIQFSDLMDALPKLQMQIKRAKEVPNVQEKRLAQSLVIIDMKTIDKIHISLSKHQDSNADEEDSKRKKIHINDIELRKKNNILTKYIRSNHTSAISVSAIKKMKEYGIDFTHKNADGQHALDIYCSQSKGIIAKPIVEALIEAGCPINRSPIKEDEPEDKDDDLDHSDSDSDSNDDDDDDDEEKEEEEDKKKKKKKPKPEVIYPRTPLHRYCELQKSNLAGFRTLIECGADATLGYGDTDATALFCAFKESDHIDAAFIQYINTMGNIDVTGVVSEYNNKLLFNEYLRRNSKVDESTISAFVKVAGCDANSADNENDTNSIKSYISNGNGKCNMSIIDCLASLGANINEADNDGLYPIQHILGLPYTPLKTLLQRVRQMVEFGAKLRHVLSDDEVVVEDKKLYILNDMKERYERFNGCWCRTYSAEKKVKRKEKEKVHYFVAVTEYRSITFSEETVNRENLINVTLQMLIEHDPAFKGMVIDDEEDEEEEEEQQQHIVEEEQQES